MKITHENKIYQLNVPRAIALGVLKEERPQPKQGEVWGICRHDTKTGGNIILILNDNTYYTISSLNRGVSSLSPAPINDWWFDDAKTRKIANSLAEYYKNN